MPPTLTIAVFGRGALPAGVVRGVQASAHTLVQLGPHRMRWWQSDPVAAAAPGVPRGRLADARGADLWLTADCPHLLSAAELAVPRFGVLNVHWSLLPRHRGPTPATATLLAGDRTAGVTVHRATPEVDGGAIVGQWSFDVGPRDTAVALYTRAARRIEAELPALLDRVAADPECGTPQDPDAVTTHRRPTLADTRLDWASPAAELDRRIRAFTYPLAWTTWRGRRVWVSAATPVEGAGEPGQVLGAGPVVAAGEGALRLDRAWLGGLPWLWWPHTGERLGSDPRRAVGGG
ncbi:MAG: methionyl-tRNA formyltransferase [Myxococcota bacterium]